jgi:hypothetical protein
VHKAQGMACALPVQGMHAPAPLHVCRTRCQHTQHVHVWRRPPPLAHHARWPLQGALMGELEMILQWIPAEQVGALD